MEASTHFSRADVVFCRRGPQDRLSSPGEQGSMDDAALDDMEADPSYFAGEVFLTPLVMALPHRLFVIFHPSVFRESGPAWSLRSIRPHNTYCHLFRHLPPVCREHSLSVVTACHNPCGIVACEFHGTVENCAIVPRSTQKARKDWLQTDSNYADRFLKGTSRTSVIYAHVYRTRSASIEHSICKQTIA